MKTRVLIIHLASSGNAICVIYNREGTFRVPPFMLYADHFNGRT